MSPREMLVKHLLHFLLILTAAACTQARSASPDLSPESAVPQQQISPNQVLGPIKTWTLTSTAIPRRYTSAVTTMLEFLTDSGVIRETVTSKTSFTFSLTPGSQSPLFTAIVHEFALEAGARATVTGRLAVLPFSFTGRVTSNGFTLETLANQPIPETPACVSSVMSTVTPILRTLLVVPTILTVGDTWDDSSSIDTCSGVIPTTLTMVRHYRVLGEIKHEGIGKILLERIDTVSIAGEGSQKQHRINVTGHGVGSSKLYLDLTAGYLRNAAGEQKTILTIISSGRRQQFTQVVREMTVLSPIQ